VHRRQLVKIKLDKSKKLWYNSCTKKKTKSKQGKKQQEPKLLSKLISKLFSVEFKFYFYLFSALAGKGYMSHNEVDLSPVKVDVLEPAQPRRRGRPPKSLVQSKKKPGKVGRPVGDAGRIQEFKARLLSTSGTKVIDTVLRKALDDNDKDQVACLKMCMDRLLPTSLFEKDAKGQRNAVTINITGLGETKVEAVETIDAEIIDYNEIDDE
jgi:hypothetical protein